MRRFDREVIDIELIDEMLKLFHTVHLGLTDEKCPYVVPLNFGHEIKADKLCIYIHTGKKGHKVDLIRKHPYASVTFSEFNDFPEHKYKQHVHDYRSVMAHGSITRIDGEKDLNAFKHAFDLLYICNNREIKEVTEAYLKTIDLYCIECDIKDVTAKSEFPIRTKEDVPFIDVYHMPDDETPFDISDIIQARKQKH